MNRVNFASTTCSSVFSLFPRAQSHSVVSSSSTKSLIRYQSAGVLGLDETVSLRSVLLKRFTDNWCNTYGIRPSKLFDGVDQRLCIYLSRCFPLEGHRQFFLALGHPVAQKSVEFLSAEQQVAQRAIRF